MESLTATLTIDLNALVTNYRTFSRMVTPAECSGVVKADAYGLGAIKVSETLYQAGCRRFYVAVMEEGIELRKAGLADDAIITVLHGIAEGQEAQFRDYQLQPVVNSVAQWQEYQHYQGVLATRLHI